MRKIYIVFLASNYKTGEMIRFLTRAKYNHVALALDEDLGKLYSFSRINYFEPLAAGYTEETLARYMKRKKTSLMKICTYEVSDEHYQRIKEKIQEYHEDENAVYNYADIFIYPLKKHIPLKHIHTCISFVLENLEIPHFMRIGELEKNLDNNVLFEGTISEYLQDKHINDQEYFTYYGNRAKYMRYLKRNAFLLQQVFLYLMPGA